MCLDKMLAAPVMNMMIVIGQERGEEAKREQVPIHSIAHKQTQHIGTSTPALLPSKKAAKWGRLEKGEWGNKREEPPSEALRVASTHIIPISLRPAQF
eukprot:evm.model.NODE_15480_length_1056_cov_27.528410.1